MATLRRQRCMPAIGAPWQSLALEAPDRTYVAVWQLESETDSVLLPLPHLHGLTPAMLGPQEGLLTGIGIAAEGPAPASNPTSAETTAL